MSAPPGLEETTASPNTISVSGTGDSIPPSKISNGEEVKPPVCYRCGELCYDGERLKDGHIYCIKCLKEIVEAVIKLLDMGERFDDYHQHIKDILEKK